MYKHSSGNAQNKAKCKVCGPTGTIERLIILCLSSFKCYLNYIPATVLRVMNVLGLPILGLRSEMH